MTARELSLVVAQFAQNASQLAMDEPQARAQVILAVNSLLAAKSHLQTASRLQGEPQGSV